MCGIVGAVASRDITPVLIDGLKRLEYPTADLPKEMRTLLSAPTNKSPSFTTALLKTIKNYALNKNRKDLYLARKPILKLSCIKLI